MGLRNPFKAAIYPETGQWLELETPSVAPSTPMPGDLNAYPDGYNWWMKDGTTSDLRCFIGGDPTVVSATDYIPYFDGPGRVNANIGLRFNPSYGLVVNDAGGSAIDFRVETDNNSSAFFVDASADLASFGVRVTTASTSTYPAIAIGSVAGDPSTLANGDIWYNSTSNKFRARQNGSTVDLISAAGVTGSGAANEIAYWSSSSAITGSSTLLTDGTYISIGSTVASTGVIRLANNTQIIHRNNADSGNVISVFVNTNDQVIIGNSTGAKVLINGDASGTLGFFNSSLVTKRTSGADLTNNVTSGGTDDVIADFAASSYSTDAATIRNDIYQLARKLKQINDGLRAYGLFT